MNLSSYRATRGLSLESCAAELELRSKGHLSNIETGVVPVGVDLALRIEAWSGGEVRALEMLAGDRRALLAAALERARA